MAGKPITRTPTRSRALAYLREGRVRIILADTASGTLRPSRVEAIVRGLRSDDFVELGGTLWYSTCGCDDASRCPHRLAVQLVTGHAPTPDMAVSPAAATEDTTPPVTPT
jgi:hypothetical protein